MNNDANDFFDEKFGRLSRVGVYKEEGRDRTENHESQVEVEVKVEIWKMLDGATFRVGKKKNAEANDRRNGPEPNRSPNLERLVVILVMLHRSVLESKFTL